MFRIILASTLFFLLHCSVLAQTPGMIVQPATGTGPSIFDPNGDGYVSQNNQGFISDDQTESEIPFTSLIFPGTEPIGDINNGPNCGFTDFVDQGDRDPAQKYLSPAGNWLFRLRLGGIAPNAKSYSILIDTDGLFGNTGSYADPNYTLDNPGFEIEIVLATHFGVFVYDVQNTTPNCTPVISYPGTTHYQKSIAGSTNCNDPDYFYDFYVVFADLASHFGITTSTLMRYVIVDNMAAQASTVCQPNSASDIGGVGNCPNLATCFQTIINYQGFCSPNTSNCTERSLCPSINAPINSGATSVSGTSTEPNGTTIRVYNNNILIGTTTVSSGVWTLSSISPALASNDVITATAQAPNEYVSEALCEATTVGSTCTNAPLTAQLSTISGNKGIRITLTAGTLVPGSLIHMYNPDGTLFDPSVLIAGAVNPITTVAGTNIYNFECQTGQCFPSGTYYISFQQPGQCESSQTPYCFNTSSSTQIPTVTTSPILDNLSSISGTVPAPDNVAGVSINVYVNGFIQAIATSGAGGAWTATGLNLNPCDTIRVQGSGSGKCFSALSSNYLVSGGTTATPTVTGNYCTSGTISSVTGVSSEANGTLITLFLNGVSSGTTTLSNGAFTFTGLSINSGTSIYVRAQAACKSQSSNSNTVTVTSLSSSAGLSLTTNPVLEGASTLSGTGTNGNTVQVLIDGYPVGNSVTVTGGVWTVSGIQSFELYANGALTLTTTSGANCASAPITAGVVLCNIPSQNLSVTPDSILFCGNSTVGSISIANAQSSVIYQLTNQAGTNIGSSVLGTGSTITLSTGTLNASGIVKVKALKLPPTCQSFQLDTIVVILNPTPNLSLGVSSQNPVVCTGTSTNIIVANSQAGFTYQLRNNANNALIGSPISGNGNNLSLPTGNLTNNTTFNILATGTSPTSCSGQLSQTVTVTVTNTPNAPTLGTITQPTCGTPSGSVVISSPASGTGFEYAIDNGSFQASNAFSGIAAGTHQFTVRPNGSTCVSAQTPVTINAVPSLPATPGVSLTQPTCATPTGTIAFTTQAGVQYGVNGTFQAGASFAGLAPGNYTIAVRSTTDNTCVTNGTAQIINAVPSLPATPSVTLTQPTCATPTGTIAFTTQAGVQYGVNGTFQAGASFAGLAPGNYTIAVQSTTDNTCVTNGTAQTINAVPSCPPTANNDSGSGNEDSPVTLPYVQGNDVDTNGSVLTNTIDLDPNTPGIQGSYTSTNGTWSVNPITGNVVFTPNSNFNGTESISYTIQDNSGLTSNNATLSVTLSPVNDAPIALNDLANTNEDTPVTITVIQNDSDVDGTINPGSVSVTTNPSNGTFTINPTTGAITYTPNPNFNGTDSLVYQVCDNGTPMPAQCDFATVIFNVTPINDPPIANNDLATTNEDTPITVNVTGNDTDLDGSIVPSTVNVLTAPNHGTVTINQFNGAITYTPNTNFNGTDSLVYQVCDNGTPLPSQCDIATLYFTVTPVNDPPVTDNENITLNEDGSFSGDLTDIGDFDPDSTNLVCAPTPGFGPFHGTIVINSNGTYTYTPNQNYFGPDTVIIEVCDNGLPLPGLCTYDTIFINVNAVNDAPIANQDNANTFEGNQVSLTLLANDLDIDGTIDASSGTIITNGANGNATLSNGIITYIPNPGFTGNDTITYQICDNGIPVLCDTAIVLINVLPCLNNPNADCDGDGVINSDEILDGTDPSNGCSLVIASQTLIPSNAWIQSDCDGDGVDNGTEGLNNTNPLNPCSYLAANQTSPTSPSFNQLDCDGDGVVNIDEIDPDGDGIPGPNGTDPQNSCSLNVALISVAVDTLWAQSDCDGDGVTNGDEIDPDGDGFIGPNETNPTDPCSLLLTNQSLAPNTAWLNLDCDGDGVNNGLEVDPDGDGTPGPNGTDPQNPCSLTLANQSQTPSAAWYSLDCDGDGVTNEDEIDPDGDGIPGPNGTDPSNPCALDLANLSIAPSQNWLDSDCDGDGVSNGDEIDPNGDGIPGPNGTDILNPCSYNPADQLL
ncbi:MAG: tandem-95 repeat protein, partial [Flavobacteriales bacterium]